MSEQDSFQQQALGHLTDLYSTAMRFVKNEKDAEDLVQETILRALAGWQQFQQGTNCRAWLFRIMTNNYINEYRRLNKERRWISRNDPLISPARLRAATDPESVFFEHMLADEVLEALRKLPQEFYKVVVLADLHGLSYREVAEQLGCPLGTVMSRLFRARRLLEAALGEYARQAGICRLAAA